MHAVSKQYPVVITEKISDCKRFYEELFGFKTVFEADWYVQLANDQGVEFGFMKPNLDNQPGFLHAAYAGGGVITTLEIGNAQEEYQRLKEAKQDILLPYTEEEWGQKHFMMRDPSGMVIDLVERSSQPS